MAMPETPVHTPTEKDRTTDLWSFALRCYSVEQTTLLGLQASARLHINDALFAAYARAHRVSVDAGRWQQVRTDRPRRLLLRVRRIRQRLQRSDPTRSRVLEWELDLERWDLARLASCLVGFDGDGGNNARMAAVLSEQCDLSADEVDGLLDRLQHSAQREPN